jgi:hypothetical protein
VVVGEGVGGAASVVGAVVTADSAGPVAAAEPLALGDAVAVGDAPVDGLGDAPVDGLGDAPAEAAVERDGPLELANTPVMVGTAEVTAAAEGSEPADEREVRPARYHTMPTSTATVTITRSIRRIQYVVGLDGPTGCITRATVVSQQSHPG